MTLRLPLSFDWEDWWQLCLPGFTDGARFEDRLTLATERSLELCADLGAKATWFCLVDQAQRHPRLLRRIQAEGHRIALHGREHTRVCDLDRPTFRRWLDEGRSRLEDLCGERILGFRAPEWSLRGRAENHIEELPAQGFRYDSSRAPLPLLGDPRWPRRRHRWPSGLESFPPPVAGVGLASVPLWGWGLRRMPEPWLRKRFEALARAHADTPLVLHPWELDSEQPNLPLDAPWYHRWAHGTGLRGLGDRVRRLWRGFELAPIETFLEEGTRVS